MAQIVKKQIVKPIELKDTHGNVTARYDEEMVEAVKNTVAKGATDSELFMFLKVASNYDLDPFLGEIYFAKFKDKNTGEEKSQILSSRDGFRKIAKRQPTYKNHFSDYVCKNDEFKTIKRMGQLEDIIHSYEQNDRGGLVGAYCVLTTTNGEVYHYYAEFKNYNTGKGAWNTYPTDMIIKVAETRVFKAFADVNGVQPEEAMPEEFSSENNTELLEEKEEIDFIETKKVSEEL